MNARFRHALPIPLLAMALAGGGASAADFRGDILPILSAKCFECHSVANASAKGGLRLDQRPLFEKGGDGGPIVVSGKPEESALYQRVSLPADDLDIMPPEGKGHPLTPAQLELLAGWIRDGADFGDWTGAEPAEAAPAPKPARAKAPPLAEPEWSKPSPFAPESTVAGAAAQIDRLVEEGLRAAGLEPNPLADEATFLRRVYLDAVGRIPTYDETVEYLEDESPDKAARLVDRLLASEGFVSRQYNYWADVLRVKSRLRGGVDTTNYQEWIKDSLRDDMPYDEFVREMIVGSGHIDANGAVGYYLRDQGMPLDNMANTVQTFLGTSLACAQCHDHPFDRWTQKEFYGMAAYTIGVSTRAPLARKQRELMAKVMRKEEDNRVLQTARNMVRRSTYGHVAGNPRKDAKLPDDYPYDDGKPGDAIPPSTIFGESPEIPKGRDPRFAYAEWMTSPENPRFTATIANRLWDQVMGRALVEPVDDLKDTSASANPRLLAYLQDLMKSRDYSRREFLRVLYNTNTYRRESSVADDPDAPYLFPGPALRRMTAEQLWDSVLTLLVPDLDMREGPSSGGGRYGMISLREIQGASPDEIIDMAKRFLERREGGGKPKILSDADGAAEVPPAMESAGSASESPFMLTASSPRKPAKRAKPASKPARRVPPLPPGFVRASELPQPAPAGHFLEQFGQSDRETIDGASEAVTVSQILTLLNGPMHGYLARPDSVLKKALDRTSRTPSGMAEALFLSLYNRYPTEAELATAMEVISASPRDGIQDLTWVMLNTQRFMFVE